jgi:DDE superfamily endonuclease
LIKFALYYFPTYLKAGALDRMAEHRGLTIGIKIYNLSFCRLPSALCLSSVIINNCSIHKGKEIENLIEAAGAKLIYLPPYSPDFSPIENCWSKIKNLLRSLGARSYPDLAKAIETAFSQVSLNDIYNWFTHCCYCTSLD